MLDGNSPRFPWKPSTTMLISRHTGTTDDSVSDRSAHTRFSSRPRDPKPEPRATVSRTPIFVPPRRVPQGPGLLICVGAVAEILQIGVLVLVSIYSVAALVVVWRDDQSWVDRRQF